MSIRRMHLFKEYKFLSFRGQDTSQISLSLPPTADSCLISFFCFNLKHIQGYSQTSLLTLILIMSLKSVILVTKNVKHVFTSFFFLPFFLMEQQHGIFPSAQVGLKFSSTRLRRLHSLWLQMAFRIL